MSAVDYGFVLVVLDPSSGVVRPLRGAERESWLAAADVSTVRDGLVPGGSASTVDVPVRLPDLPPVRRSRRVLAGCALLRVLVAGAGRGGFGGLIRLMSRSTARAVRPATIAEVTEALAAARWVVRTCPVRERARTEVAVAVVLLGWSRTKVSLRHGVTVDPVEVHTWLEVDGQPVSEPSSVARYTAFPSLG